MATTNLQFYGKMYSEIQAPFLVLETLEGHIQLVMRSCLCSVGVGVMEEATSPEWV